MAKLILFTGGARSGKSRLAEARVKTFKRVAYIATAQALDDEMRERIAKHKQSRPAEWLTLEEPLDLSSAIKRAANVDAILIDCLTLWLSNRLLAVWDKGWNTSEEDIVMRALEDAVSAVTSSSAKECVIVTNEVGSGIVPENAMSRAFRDLTGRANQVLASKSEEVFMIAVGLPMKLK